MPIVLIFLIKDITYLRELFGRNTCYLVFILGSGRNLGLEFKSSAQKFNCFSGCSLFFIFTSYCLILQGNGKGERIVNTHVN